MVKCTVSYFLLLYGFQLMFFSFCVFPITKISLKKSIRFFFCIHKLFGGFRLFINLRQSLKLQFRLVYNTFIAQTLALNLRQSPCLCSLKFLSATHSSIQYAYIKMRFKSLKMSYSLNFSLSVSVRLFIYNSHKCSKNGFLKQ